MSQASPDRSPRVQPFLIYADVSAAIECLTRAFGFSVRNVAQGPDGQTEHAVLDIYDGRVMLRRGAMDQPPSGSVTYVYVDDVDDHFSVAQSTGLVELLSTPTDQPWGDRVYDVRDGGGHQWAFAQRLA